MKVKGGWDFNLLQYPDSFHICLTSAHLESGDTSRQFCDDLKYAVDYCLSSPNEKVTGMAELYCSKSKIPVFINADYE